MRIEPTKEQIKEAKRILNLIVNNKLPDHETKAEMITLYNTVYIANYKVTTNCSSCLKLAHLGLIQIANYNKV